MNLMTIFAIFCYQIEKLLAVSTFFVHMIKYISFEIFDEQQTSEFGVSKNFQHQYEMFDSMSFRHFSRFSHFRQLDVLAILDG